ncbi:hypothetical protein ACFYP4_18695 [Streptomyces sp. NPDC005551]|uniref:hypothetical protein n=1 Tax=unclassified Streptomyces TaxID=2593676 RepID=UPI0033D75E35
MTSLLSRGRARAAYALAGGMMAAGWLLPPVAATAAEGPAAGAAERPDATAAPPARPSPPGHGAADPADENETSGADLVLPLATVTVAGALAAYGYLRRTRRARTRTTPGGAPRPRADATPGSPGSPGRGEPPDPPSDGR